jgi:hypothetical protein
MQMVFIMNLACVTAESAACVKCGINTCDDNSSCVVSMPKWWGSYLEEREELSGEQGYRNLCCMCSKLGVIFFLNTFRILDISFGAPLYLFLANIIFAQVCYQLGAMCGCCQAQPWRRRLLAEWMGHLLLVVILAVLLATMPIFISYAYHNGLLLKSLTNFVVGKAGATIGTTIAQTCVFALLWPRQRMAKNFFVTEEDFTGYRSMLEQLAHVPEDAPDDITNRAYSVTPRRL